MRDIDPLGLALIIGCLIVIAGIFDGKDTFTKQCKEAGGVPVATSRANVCLSINAIIKLEE